MTKDEELIRAVLTEEESMRISEFAYKEGIKQALEIIKAFPNKPAGWNEGRDKIYEALKEKFNEHIKTSKK